MKNKGLYAQLSLLMFIQLAILGAFHPILSMYLRDYLGFSGDQAGLIQSMSVISSLVSPLVSAFLVDRVFTSKQLLAICNVAGAALLTALSFQTEFVPFLVMFSLVMVVVGPTIGFMNSITFENLEDGQKSFGYVRLWGTVGWIAVAWFFSFFWLKGNNASERLPDAFRLSAVLSLGLFFYTFTLPKSKGKMEKKPASLIPQGAFKVMMEPEIIFLTIFSFIASSVDRFYSFGASIYLKQIGFAPSDIMPALSLGQMPEVLSLFILAPILARLGYKKVFLLGIGTQILRYLMLAFSNSEPVILVAVSLNGFVYAFFFALCAIYLDEHCDDKNRGGVHQLFNVIFLGLAGFVGNLAAGKVSDFLSDAGGQIDFQTYWTIPAVISFATLIMIAVFLKGKAPVVISEPVLEEVE